MAQGRLFYLHVSKKIHWIPVGPSFCLMILKLLSSTSQNPINFFSIHISFSRPRPMNIVLELILKDLELFELYFIIFFLSYFKYYII